MSKSEAVGNRAWIELLHAETCWALETAGIDALVIKGPSTADWLYPEGGRESADVDLVVDPGTWDDAITALVAQGFEVEGGPRRLRGWTPGVERYDLDAADSHSVELIRSDVTQGRHQIDLHFTFTGLDVSPATAWAVLWRRRQRHRIADVDVWFPDICSRAVLILVHTGRSVPTPKTLEDANRVVTELGRANAAAAWPEVVELARDLGALGALRLGIETVPDGDAITVALGIDTADPDPEIALNQMEAVNTAHLANVMLEIPWRRRPAALWHYLMPPEDVIRRHHPDIGPSHLALTRAYVRRAGRGIRDLPRAVRQVRSARRGTGR